MAGEPTFFSEGHESRREDTLWKIEQKILGALNDGAGGVGSMLTGPWADPNGNITPNNVNRAALYQMDDPAVVSQWRWSVDDQVWYENIGP